MTIMRVARVSTNGQIFLPADVRRRWAVREVTLTDLGESLLVQPVGPREPALFGASGQQG
jgi:hypothetical protein